MSAVAISKDGMFVCFADKFGVVWALDLDGFVENQVLVDKKAAPVLAHYCSIITSLVCHLLLIIFFLFLSCSFILRLTIGGRIGITGTGFCANLCIQMYVCLNLF